MTRKYIVPALLGFALFFVALAPLAHADAWDKKTIATFSQPIEIPGKVIPAGTYVFKLMDSPSNRHIVRIMNERENEVIATVLAIPNYRLEPRDKTTFTFYEMPIGQAEVLHEWFYPGDNFGQEFAYSKQRTVEILAAVRQGRGTQTEVQVAAVAPAEATAPTLTATEIPAQPIPPVETAQTTPLPEPVATDDNAKLESPSEEAAEPQAPAPDPQPADDTSMPKTASQLGLIGLLGAFSAIGAVSVRRYRNSGSQS